MENQENQGNLENQGSPEVQVTAETQVVPEVQAAPEAQHTNTVQNNTVTEQQQTQLRQYGIIAYALFFANILIPFTAIVAVIMAYVKRNDAQGTIYASHLQYIIKTFWVSFGLSVIGFITLLIVIGWLILLASIVWTIYRLVKGIMALLDGKEIDTQTWF